MNNQELNNTLYNYILEPYYTGFIHITLWLLAITVISFITAYLLRKTNSAGGWLVLVGVVTLIFTGLFGAIAGSQKGHARDRSAEIIAIATNPTMQLSKWGKDDSGTLWATLVIPDKNITYTADILGKTVMGATTKPSKQITIWQGEIDILNKAGIKIAGLEKTIPTNNIVLAHASK